MATASPIQLYEKVSEAEALSRNDHLNGQLIYQVPQEEALRRKARYENCEKRCYYSYYAERTICQTICNTGWP